MTVDYKIINVQKTIIGTLPNFEATHPEKNEKPKEPGIVLIKNYLKI